jgi:hypothetical protein
MVLSREEEQAIDALVIWLHQIARNLKDDQPRVAADAVSALLKAYRDAKFSRVFH